MGTILMDTEQVRTAIADLERREAELQIAADRLKTSVNRLSWHWSSPSSTSFISRGRAEVESLEHRVQRLGELLASLRQEVAQWEQVDAEGQNSFAKQKNEIAEDAWADKTRRLNDLIHQGGKTYLIDMDQYDLLNMPDQYEQKGGNCVLYGLLHFAYMQGVVLSQAEIDALIDKYRPWWVLDFMGIPLWSVNDILKDLGLDSRWEGNIFQLIEGGYRQGGDGWTFDLAGRQNDLVEQLQNGNPVYVMTDAEMFDPRYAGIGHNFTVLGVNLDAQGNIASVILDTNWGPSVPDIMTVDGADFLRDWATQGCQMVTVPSSGGGL